MSLIFIMMGDCNTQDLKAEYSADKTSAIF